MKKLIGFLIGVILFFGTNASSYYVSNTGNDANSGTSPSNSWQTLGQVRSFTFNPGDSIVFNRGDIFYGYLYINQSGTSGNPITFGAYGSGVNPIISGFTNVTSWSNLGGNIWESTSAVGTLSSCNMVVINGVNTPMGRYPNTGWLTYQSVTGNGKVTTSFLTGAPNWTGAEAVTKKNRFIIQRNPIVAQSSGTLTYGGDTTSYTPNAGFGLFIQNDPRTLDATNEWYYNPVTNKLRIYSISTPTNVQITTVDTLIKITSNYITINNISFTGGNSYIAHLNNATGVNINNCIFSFGGINAVRGNNSPTATIQNNSFTNINNAAVTLDGANSSILNNIIKRTGLTEGFTGIESTSAITSGGAGSSVKFNNIDSSGYCGIFFNSVSKVDSNFINHSCMTIDDGAGIYTSLAFPSGREIIGNIVLNSIGSLAGTGQSDLLAYGIYLDAYTDSVIVKGNTVSGCVSAGILSSNNNNITIRNNTFYNNATSTTFTQGEIMLQYICCNFERNNVIKNNLFIAKNIGKLSLFYYNVLDSNDVKLFGVADSNYYARPIDDNNVFNIQTPTNPYPGTSYNLAGWKTFTGQDANSHKSPLAISNVNQLDFEYNATNVPVTKTLYYTYQDVKGVNYNSGSITLQPYSSAVLIQTGSLTIPATVPKTTKINHNNIIN